MNKFIIAFTIFFLQAGLAFSGNRSGCAFREVPDTLSMTDSLSSGMVVKDSFFPVSKRVDRGINEITYVYKNEIALGIEKHLCRNPVRIFQSGRKSWKRFPGYRIR